MNRRALLIGGMASLLAACTREWRVDYASGVSPTISKNWRLQNVKIIVPDTLTVSDSNRMAPSADIVWHGDAPGDRRAQVAAIMREAVTKGAQGLNGSIGVDVVVTLRQFHAVTPVAVSRAPGAVHNIGFDIQVQQAGTGLVVKNPEFVQADLEAYVGSAAATAAVNGQTQKVRIIQHVAAVTRGWLGIGPDGRRTFRSYGR